MSANRNTLLNNAENQAILFFVLFYFILLIPLFIIASFSAVLLTSFKFIESREFVLHLLYY